MLDKLYAEANRLVNDKIIAILKEQGPKVAFAHLYTLMPLPLRLLVKEDAFINFCIANKDRITGKPQTKKAAPKKVAARKAVTTKTAVKKVAEPKTAARKTAAKKVIAAKKGAKKPATKK